MLNLVMLKYITLFVSFLHFFTKAHDLSRNNTSPTENLHLNLFQGDIFLRNGFLEQVRGRSAITYDWAKWPDGIVYYELDESYGASDVELIEEALQEFHQLTCVRFKKRENDEQNNYVEIENTMGCYAEGGMQGGPQILALESPRCMKKGVILHELMHTLGFLHEVSRPDRDEYVTVHFDNIIAGMEQNFVKMTPRQLDTLDLEYDYKSVMHYKAWAYAEDKSEPTITPTNNDVNLSDLGLAQETGQFTDTDIQKVKKFYNC